MKNKSKSQMPDVRLFIWNVSQDSFFFLSPNCVFIKQIEEIIIIDQLIMNIESIILIIIHLNINIFNLNFE